MVITNTLPIPSEKHFDSLTVLSIAPIVGHRDRGRLLRGHVSELFKGDNM